MSRLPLDAAIRAAQSAARQRNAVWDADDFMVLCEQARPELEMLDPGSLQAWLRIATEPCQSRTLRACLSQAGKLLAPVAEGDRPACLVDLFNLCEGLAQAEPWFDPFVVSRLDGLGDLSDLPTLVELALDDVLAPQPAAQGPLQEIELSPVTIDPLFVPGKLWLAGPRIVCVADRRRDVCLGLALGADQITLFGPLPPLEVFEALEGTTLTLEEGYRLRNGEQTIYLDTQYPVHSSLFFGSNACLAATDSQRIWVLRPEAA